MKLKIVALALGCLAAGFVAGQMGKIQQIRTTADEVAQDILKHCDTALERKAAECAEQVAQAIQTTSDETLAECERRIDEITDAADDEISTLEILLEETKQEDAYKRGFNDCLAQF